MAENTKTKIIGLMATLKALLEREAGRSPGQCESCGAIISHDERYGVCPDTEALTCPRCLPAPEARTEGEQ